MQAGVAIENFLDGATQFCVKAPAIQCSAKPHAGCLFHFLRRQHGDVKFFDHLLTGHLSPWVDWQARLLGRQSMIKARLPALP